MRSLIFFLTTTALIGAAACSQAEPSAPAEYKTKAVVAAPATPATETATPVGAQVDPTAALPKPNDDYWTARKALLAAGFTPVDAPEPVDGNSQDFMVCTEGMEAQRSMSEDECPSALVPLVEVEACAGSGMGNCKTVWTAPDGRRLNIYTIDGPQPGIVSAVEWAQN